MNSDDERRASAAEAGPGPGTPCGPQTSRTGLPALKLPPPARHQRASTPHCGRCMKPPHTHAKVLNKDAWYRISFGCDEELRARGEQDSKAWRCPTAREGHSGCLCCTAAKKQQVGSSYAKSKK